MAAISSAAGTNAYNTNAAWVGGVQPTAADDVTITASTTVNIPTGTTALARSVTVQALGTLKFDTGSSTLTIGDATAGAGNVAFSNAGTITLTGVGTINFISTSTTQQTVATGGQTMPNIVYNGALGSWLASDACVLNSAANWTLTTGTFATGNNNVTARAVVISGAATRVWTPGSATYNITGTTGSSIFDASTTTGLTVTANSAIVRLSASTTGGVNLGGFNFNGMTLTMDSAAQGAPVITSSGATIAALNWTGPATKTSTPTIVGNLTCTGAFTWTGNSAINRSILSPSTTVFGTSITITAATASLTNVDLKDITWSVAGSFTISSVGDCGGLSGITVTTPVTRYAVVAGNVSSTATWSASSGGAGGQSVPLPQDIVNFGGGSAVGTYTNDMPRWGTNVDFTQNSGFTRTFSNGINWETYGNLTLNSSASMTWSGNSGVQFAARTSATITSAGNTIGTSGVVLQGPSGTWTLQDALNTTGATVHTDGTLNTNGFSYTTTTLTSSGTRTRVLTFGASTINLSSTATTTVWNITATGLTINAGTSNIVISAASANTRTTVPAAFNYNTFTYSVAASSGQLTFGAATYVAKLDMDISSTGTARTLNFNTGSSYTIANFNVKGSSGNVVSVKTGTGGTAVTLALLGPVSTCDWLDVRDINSTMPYKFYAGVNSVSTGGGNTNVLLADKVSQPSIWNAANASSSGTTITATLPASLTATAGNILLATWTASTTSVSGMTAPSGYTLVDNNTVANTPQVYMWYKVATGGETAATVTTTSSHTTTGLSLMELGSFSGNGTLDVFAHTDSAGALTAQASASVTNTGTPAIAIASYGAAGTTGALVSTTNSWQEQRITQLANPRYFALPLTTTGAQTTTYTWTTSRTSANVAVIFKDVALGTGNFFQFF